jgi:hypothetical protein
VVAAVVVVGGCGGGRLQTEYIEPSTSSLDKEWCACQT